MPRGKPKSKPASRFLILDAQKYLDQPNIASSPESELDKLKTKRMKRRLAKIEAMEADMYLKEVEDELKKRKGLTKTGAASTAQSDQLVKGLIENPEIQKQWINMDPQQRNLILASIQAVKSKGGETATLGGMMPLLFMQMQRKPDTSIAEMVQLIKAVSPPQQPQVTIKDIIELQKSQQGQQTQTGMMKDILDAVKPIYMQSRDQSEKLYEERMKRMEDRIINPLDALKEIKSFNEALGVGTTNNPELAMKIEEVRGDRELKMEEMRQNRLQQERQFHMEQQNRQWDREDTRQRWQMLEGVMQGPIGKGLEKLGEGAATRISGQPTSQPPSQIPNPIKITCPKCNKPFVGSSDAVTVNCPHCGQQLQAVRQPEQMARSPQPEQLAQGAKSIGGVDGTTIP